MLGCQDDPLLSSTPSPDIKDGQHSGKVQGRFREDSGKVQGKFSEGSVKVQ